MKIETFTEEDIREAAQLAYPVWGEGHAANGQGEEALAKSEGYENLYLWTDSSCNHGYYAHHGFERVAEFKSNEWKTDSDDYITYIYRMNF